MAEPSKKPDSIFNVLRDLLDLHFRHSALTLEQFSNGVERDEKIAAMVEALAAKVDVLEKRITALENKP